MTQDDIEDRVAEKVEELGRKLTPQELIEVINNVKERVEDGRKYEIDRDGESV